MKKLVILPFVSGTAQELSAYERALARRLVPSSTSSSMSRAVPTRLSSPERTCGGAANTASGFLSSVSPVLKVALSLDLSRLFICNFVLTY